MVVQHNMQAMNANRMLNVTTKSQAKATEKLSSGYKINRAADDAAGLSISEKMRKQIKGLDQASSNAQDGISAVQTAEGALTEVHSMLQRMNELAVQAANGTNSASDRQAIQNEIDQLTTEIDRVAETTKFNETYLLKGNGKSSTAVVTMTALRHGQTISIGAKGYTIGSTVSSVQGAVRNADTSVKNITINGTEYKIVDDASKEVSEDNILTKDHIAELVKDTDKVIVGTQTYVAMVDGNNAKGIAADGIGDNDGSVITAKKAYELIADELRKASSVGADAGNEATVDKTASGVDYTTATEYKKGQTQISFKITEGTVNIKQGLQMGLHVGADADGTNKISFTIDTMDAAGLGIKNLNVMDTTGAKATYAIDAISEALSKVSAQRSELGAIQNRLEHTINNLDNVVENTTSAESQIRDTDMAEEMVEYSKNNILAQAGQSMLAQANQSTQGVLSLLQ